MADFSKYFRAYMNMQDILKNDFTYNYIMEALKTATKARTDSTVRPTKRL